MQPPNPLDPGGLESDVVAAKRPPRRYSPPTGSHEHSMVSEPVPIVRGTLIGDYRVERRLDEGGMGTVYAAVHPIIDKRVAIKVLHPHVARQDEAVVRFIQEARAVNAIGHPGIVDIFGFGRFVDGRHFITMEYLEGQQLLAFLNETGPISALPMIPVARQLAESLAAAHDKGVLHRDLKPENVFLGVTSSTYKDQPWPPRTKILDFGLAKLIEVELEETAPHTRSGVTVGTPYYMSPEQCRGRAVDRRADIYALGVMMYEMVTGRVPFYASESVDVLYMHLTQAPEPPSRHRPLPPRVEELILGCMAKNAQERPQSMRALITELDAIYGELCPEAAAKDRPSEELQAEASAFFGGVDDAESPPVEAAEPSLSAQTTLPRFPESVSKALDLVSLDPETTTDEVRQVASSSDFDEAMTPIKTPVLTLRSARAHEVGDAPPEALTPGPGGPGAQTTSLGFREAPMGNPGLIPSLPEAPTMASSAPTSTQRPSLPTPMPGGRKRVPTEEEAPASPPVARATPAVRHRPEPAGDSGGSSLPASADTGGAVRSAKGRQKARSSEDKPNHDVTDPVMVRPAPRRREPQGAHGRGTLHTGSAFVWALLALQSVIIVILILLLWRR